MVRIRKEPPGVNSRAMSGKKPSGSLLIFVVGLLCLVWGSTWFVIKVGLEDIPPFTGAGIRFALAALGMSLVAHLFAGKEGGDPPPVRLVLAMGGLNFAASYGIVYWVETRVPSALVSVLWASYPIFLSVVSTVLLPEESLRGRQWFGLVVGFAGIAILFARDLSTLGAEVVVAGAVLLLSPLVSAVGTALVKRDGAGVSSLLLNRNGMILGAALLLGLAMLTESGQEVRWTGSAVGSLLYLSFVGTVFTFGLYYWAMRYAPAYQLGMIAYITPAIAIALGVGLGGEPVTRFTLLGGGLVLVGVTGVLSRPASRGPAGGRAPAGPSEAEGDS